LRPDASLSQLVRDIKANSSRFINEKRWVMGRFSWQEGFGAFSYSRSQLGAVIRYIENQQKHLEYDPRYIFKGIDNQS
jgi:putative transposase